MPTTNNVSKILRGALAKRAKAYKDRLMKIGCVEPDKDDPKRMAAAILRARKQNKKKAK